MPALKTKARKLSLGPQSNGERGWRYELLRGVLVVTPLPFRAESDPNEELGHWLRAYRDEQPPGHIYTLAEQTLKTGPKQRRADRLELPLARLLQLADSWEGEETEDEILE